MTSHRPQPVALSDHLHWMFPTPVISYQWPDYKNMNAELERIILEREDQKAGVQLSNAGGWQSSDDLLTWGLPATDDLKRRIDLLLYSVIKELSADPGQRPKARLRLDCWANVNREGDYNVVHNHPNSLWSGVYYVSSGKPDLRSPHAGKIELLDPREAADMIQVGQTKINNKCFLKNEPGLMILFPSWLKHMVHPHKGEGTRISIAFNAQPVF